MARAIVNSVTHNVQKTSNAGKSYIVSTLSYTTDKGQTKKADIFTTVPYFKVVRDLAQGDEIEVKMVQNNGYWNVSDIVKVDAPSASQRSPQPTAPITRAPFVEDKEKQASIQRQNALTNATNLVAQMIASEMFKKTTKPAILIEEIIKTAAAFEDYTSGREVPTKLGSQKPSVSGSTEVGDVLEKEEFGD